MLTKAVQTVVSFDSKYYFYLSFNGLAYSKRGLNNYSSLLSNYLIKLSWILLLESGDILVSFGYFSNT